MGELSRILESRHGTLKIIAVKGNGRAAIVRTTAEVASEMRERSGSLSVAGNRVAMALMSGGIGKLKRRAAGSGTTKDGEVPQRRILHGAPDRA